MGSATMDRLYDTPAKRMTANELAQKYGIAELTVKRNWKQIPGGANVNDEISFWPGSRYPFNIGLHKLETYADKNFVLLKAISQYRYISHRELGLEKAQFGAMLDNFLVAGYIAPNNLGNSDGANAYDITKDGSDFLDNLIQKKREKRAAEIDRFLDLVKKIKEILPDSSGSDKQ
jgi:hypothetical protein